MFAPLPGNPHGGPWQVAQRYGIPLDPIYSLAAWEAACSLAEAESVAAEAACGTSSNSSSSGATIVMLHCGGALGLQGLAQRFPHEF